MNDSVSHDPEPRFSTTAISLADELVNAGIIWHPTPGHFVYDWDGVLPHESPFQSRVFFILDLKHFVRYAGSIDAMVKRMRWLPAWWDARKWLRENGVSDQEVAEAIASKNAIRSNSVGKDDMQGELECLYRLMLNKLRTG